MSELQLVVFNLNGQFYGAETSQVFQIIRYQEVTKVPRMPKFLEGILNHRGEVLPVVSLNKRFDLGVTEPTRKTKILITKMDEKLAGFIVDDVSEIMKVNEEEMEPAPMLLDSEANTYLTRVAKKNDQLISVIDLQKVLKASEVKRLAIKAEAG